MREDLGKVGKKKRNKVPPVRIVKTLGKVRAGISHFNKSLAPASVNLLEMIFGGWLAQAIHVAAHLEIADHLKFGAKSIDELSDRTGTHGPSLHRLLRMLAGHGLFKEGKDGSFLNTPLSDCLRMDHPTSVRSMAIYQGGFHWKHWGQLLYSIKTGKTAVEDIEEKTFFDYISKNPEFGKIFDHAMTEISELAQESVVRGYNFGRFFKIADIGGGHGRLLSAILRANSRPRGLLVDIPRVIAGAAETPHVKEQGKRIELVAGSFFDTLPAGADCYLMKNIIHDWEEKKAAAILENVARAMPQKGKLILIEAIVPEGNAPHMSKDLDLEMLVSVGGRERTKEEYAGLLAEAGFRLENVFDTATPLSIIEASKI